MMRTVRGGLAALVVAGLVQSVGSLALVTSADAAGTTMRATTAVNVRSGPGTGYSRIGLLYPGDNVQALSSGNGWTKVSYKGRTGYVASAYLASSSGSGGGGSSSGASGDAYTTTALNLRTGPSLSYRVSTVASKGTKVKLTGTVKGEFSQVTWNGQTLWAATRYLSQSAGSPGQDLPTTTRKLRATTEFKISYDQQRRPEYRRAIISGGWNYNWQTGASNHPARHTLKLIDVDYIYMLHVDTAFRSRLPELTAKYNYSDMFIVSSGYTYSLNSYDPMRRNRSAHSLRAAIELAGNTLYGLSHLLGASRGADGSYKLFGTTYSQFVKADIDYARSIVLDARNSVAFHIGGGLGKIVSPQNLAIASTAVDAPGTDAEILKKAAPYSIGLLLVLGALVFLASQVGLGV